MSNPRLHHVTYKTTRLNEMVAWYGLVTGARVMFQNEAAAWTTNDEANHRLAFLAVPGLSDDPQKTPHNGVHHVAFEFASFDELMATFDRLRQAGVTPACCLDHGMTISLYYKDPEGNYVELQSDCFGDWAASSDFIRQSPVFAANPIGVFFDPAAVYDRHQSGVGVRELQREIRAERHPPTSPPDLGLPG